MNEKNFQLLLELFAEKNTIPYRKELRSVTKSVTGAILLQQVIYWWVKNDRKPFYKFKEPCNHELYKEGDSWCEELGFSREEFDEALWKVAFKKGTPPKKQQIAKVENAYILYWTDSERITWYALNETLLGKVENPLYLEKGKKHFTTITENTTENSYIEKPLKKKTSNKTPASTSDLNSPLLDKVSQWKQRKAGKSKSFGYKPSWDKPPELKEADLKPLDEYQVWQVAWDLKVPLTATYRKLKQVMLDAEVGKLKYPIDYTLRSWLNHDISRGKLISIEDSWMDIQVLKDQHPKMVQALKEWVEGKKKEGIL